MSRNVEERVRRAYRVPMPLRAGILLTIALALAACDRQGHWTAFVFPTSGGAATPPARPIIVEGARSLRECQEAAKTELRKRGDPGTGLYECGRDCTWSMEVQQNDCKETFRPPLWSEQSNGV